MITAPGHALDIIILTNGVPANPDDLATKVMDAILGDTLAPKVEAPPTADYKALLGRYYDDRSGMLFGFQDMDGKLGLAFFTSPPMPIDSCDEGLVSPFVKTVVGHFVFHTEGLALGDGSPAPQTLSISDSSRSPGRTSLSEKRPEAISRFNAALTTPNRGTRSALLPFGSGIPQRSTQEVYTWPAFRYKRA